MAGDAPLLGDPRRVNRSLKLSMIAGGNGARVVGSSSSDLDFVLGDAVALRIGDSTL